jgi:DNA-binding CsgD family transcriptional regulator
MTDAPGPVRPDQAGVAPVGFSGCRFPVAVQQLPVMDRIDDNFSRRASEHSFGECRRRIREALSRLALAESPEAVRAAASPELAEACGFTRAMISAVCGSRWVLLHFYSHPELDPQAEIFHAYLASDPQIALANMLAETNMVRRRTAVLVDEFLLDTRAFKPLVEASQSPAYVAAPLVVENRTIGFMHADRVGQDRSVDEFDRLHAQAFADGLAVVYERAVWNARLTERGAVSRAELDRAKNALTAIESEAGDLPFGLFSPPVAGSRAEGAIQVSYSPLTAREWEILGHIADGATNRVIAHRLSVSEETVKTHVAKLLRKLRVTTRAGAVARYLELSNGASV